MFVANTPTKMWISALCQPTKNHGNTCEYMGIPWDMLWYGLDNMKMGGTTSSLANNFGIYFLGFPHFKKLLSLGVAPTTKSAALAAKSTTTSYVCQLSIGVHPLQPCRSTHQSLDPVSSPTSSGFGWWFRGWIPPRHFCWSKFPSIRNPNFCCFNQHLFLLNPNETRIVQPAVPSWFPFRQAGAGVVKGWRSDPPEVAVHA